MILRCCSTVAREQIVTVNPWTWAQQNETINVILSKTVADALKKFNILNTKPRQLQAPPLPDPRYRLVLPRLPCVYYFKNACNSPRVPARWKDYFTETSRVKGVYLLDTKNGRKILVWWPEHVSCNSSSFTLEFGTVRTPTESLSR